MSLSSLGSHAQQVFSELRVVLRTKAYCFFKRQAIYAVVAREIRRLAERVRAAMKHVVESFGLLITS